MMEVYLVQRIHLVNETSPCYFAASECLNLNSEVFLHFRLVLEDLSSKDMRVLIYLYCLVVSVALILELSGLLDVLFKLFCHFSEFL